MAFTSYTKGKTALDSKGTLREHGDVSSQYVRFKGAFAFHNFHRKSRNAKHCFGSVLTIETEAAFCRRFCYLLELVAFEAREHGNLTAIFHL